MPDDALVTVLKTLSSIMESQLETFRNLSESQRLLSQRLDLLALEIQRLHEKQHAL